MKSTSLLAIPALCLVLSICIAGPASPAGAAETSTTAISDPGERNLSIHCGNARATIQCSAASADCTQTTLRLDSTAELPEPKGMKPYTAVGLACTKARDGTPYLVVQYGERPEGCEFCEWFHLYTTQGELLTQSSPAILKDGRDQRPNNKEFSTRSKELGIVFPDIQLLR
jgi:hypothetical protein